MLISGTATFYLSTKITQLNEVCSQDAIKYLAQDPSVKVAQVVKQFGILWNRLHFGGKPKTEVKLVNKKLSEPKERAICNYINGLDRINPTVAVLVDRSIQKWPFR